MEGMIVVKTWMWIVSWVATGALWLVSVGIIYGKLVSTINSQAETIKSLKEIVKLIPTIQTDIKVIKEHQKSQDKKIADNCNSLTDLRRSGIITTKEHSPMCKEKWENHDKSEDQRKGEVDRRLNKGEAEFVAIRSTMKEQQEFITEARVVMAKTTTTLESVQESIKEFPKMIQREVASLVNR